MPESRIAALVDAVGGGACRVGAEGVVEMASPGFVHLVGTAAGEVGVSLAETVPALRPALEARRPLADIDETFAHIGADGVRRALVAARLELDDGSWVVVVDRSREDKLRRRQTRLEGELEELRSELRDRARLPAGPRVHSMSALTERLQESLERARRYKHEVTVLHVAALGHAKGEGEVASLLLACVRGVDDVGKGGDGSYTVVLPHTDLPGGKVVATRIATRLGELGLKQTGIGVASAKRDEGTAGLIERAERAAAQAVGQGGGVLMAVDVS